MFAAAFSCSLHGRKALAATETQYKGTGIITAATWTGSANWTNGVPVTGYVADIFKNINVTYNVTTNVSPPIPTAVQIAGNTSTGTATLTLAPSSGSTYLETLGLYIGAGVTGQNGYAPGAGIGQVLQSAGSITVDAGGVLAIDPISSYSLSGSGFISAANEQNAGTFTQTGGQNLMSGGSTLTNTGTYVDATSSILSADSILNSGVFNLSGGAVQGPTTGVVTFNNTGTFLYSSGTFSGSLINNAGAIINATGASLPISGSLINNGKLTVTGATGTISTTIAGAGIMVFNGISSSVTLTGTNIYTGQTSVAAGTLILASPAGVASNNFGGAIDGNVNVSTNAILQNNANSQIANTSTVTLNGGIYNLNNHDQTIGSLVLNAGVVQETVGLGLGVASGQITAGTGTATITGGLRTTGTFTFNVDPAGTLNVNGSVGGYNVSAATLVLTGGGTLSLSGASPLSSIDVKQGTLQLSESGTLSGANISTLVEPGGTLSLTNQSLQIGDLTGAGGVALGSGALTIFSTGSTFPGTLAGSGTLTKAGSGTLTLTGSDSSSGLTSVVSGTLTLGLGGSISGSNIIIASGAAAIFNGTINTSPAFTANGALTLGANPGSGLLIRNIGILTIGTNTGGGNGVVTINPASSAANRTLLIDTGIALAGTTNAWTGKLDLTDNDMIVKNAVIPTVTNEVRSGYNLAAGGFWNGNGITSSTAAADTTHLTAVGVILNNDGAGNPVYGTGTALNLFDGYSPAMSDVLLKYTYVGDSNLDGKVDGSDYSRIDNGFLHGLTGWLNGDYNYDGVIDGTDYTLIDNAFNMQGSAIAASVADSSATLSSQIGLTSAVPEPASLILLTIAGLSSLSRRRATAPNA